jgi:hypothetical protein
MIAKSRRELLVRGPPQPWAAVDEGGGTMTNETSGGAPGPPTADEDLPAPDQQTGGPVG